MTIKKAPIGNQQMENNTWKERCELAWKTIQHYLSDVSMAAKTDKTLTVHKDGSVASEDPRVGDALNGLRANALRLINKNLQEAGLEPVKSDLVDEPHYPWP